MEFYKIESPSTKQIFDAIINKEYIPIEKIQSKAKQVKILLCNHFCNNDILVTFLNVTNSGGFPVFLTSSCSLYEVAADNITDFNELSEEDQDNQVELLGAYLRKYEDIFNF
jgi:hypothetical protein